MVVSALLIVSLAAGPMDSAAEVYEFPSVHQQAVEQYSDVQLHDIITVDSSGDAELQGTVFGFLPYWVNQAWLQYDLISVLAVFSVDMGSSGTVTNYHGFPSSFATAMDQAHANGATVTVTVTNFSGSSIHSILTTNRTAAISTICDLVNGSVADGVCIDFENVQAGDSGNLVVFMEDVRTALPAAHISICTPVVDWSGAFNYSELAESCDALMIMCYAFAGSWSSVAGPNAPLVGWGSSPESSSNMAWAVCDYICNAPNVHDKLVVGLPYYGHQWETSGSSTHSPASNCSTLFYTTLAERAETYGALWDEESLTPWYRFYSGGWNQGWYDDDQSLGLKYDMVTMAGLQGIGIWALGYDGSRSELWDELEECFGDTVPNDMITDNLEDCFQLHGPSTYWHPYTESGQYHTFFYTGSISSGPDVNWAQWNFHLPDSTASYSLEVYIPPTGNADITYRIVHGSVEDTVTVNQASFPGQWVSLGGPYDSSGGLSVVAGDNTGTSGQRIVFDAVRFTESTGIQNGSDIVPAGFTVSTSPASCFTVNSPVGGHVQVIDVSGRVVAESNLQPGGSWLWNEAVPPGVYFIGISGNTGFLSHRVVLLR
jgi:spore germination protein YaaH